MIYFDNAATGGFKPDGVTNAVKAAIKACANPGRSSHALATACAERVYAARTLIAELFNAPSAERVVFTKNCTEALNIALLNSFKAGDKIVTCCAEHNSVLRPLNYLKGKGVEVVYTPLTPDGQIDLTAIINAAQDAVAVAVTLASNVTGAGVDAAKIRSGIPEDVLLICDGAQACGRIEIDMRKSGIDALAVSGHKGMLGIQGAGALVFSERFNPRPLMFGGTGSNSASEVMPGFYPDMLEAGTLSYPAIISLGEGALYLKNHMCENRERTLYLTTILQEGLKLIKGVTLYSCVNPFGITAFGVEGIDSLTVANMLSERSVCVRGGLHCAPLMHAALRSEGLVRASLSAFNSENEIERFLRVMGKA